MIRQATDKDVPEIIRLIKSEPGMWQEDWKNDVLPRALEASGGLPLYGKTVQLRALYVAMI